MEVASTPLPNGERRLVQRSPLARLPDRALRGLLTGLAGAVLVLLGYFFIRLYLESQPAFSKFGIFGFTFGNDWNIPASIFKAWPLVAGTLITSVIALVIGVPIALCSAIYVTELCPRRVRSPLSVMVELLAAVPSVVYGLWGVFVLIPKLKPVEQWISDTFHFIPFIGHVTVAGPNYFIAGLILAIMVVPIVSSISREVMATVPPEHKEAALALGATRWEMIRMAMLPYSRAGVTGAAMLGLGRAIGETIAVTLVIGNSTNVGHSIFDQGYSLAAVIANEFGEASPGSLHLHALFAAGLVLFVLTLVINAIARGLVARAEKSHQGAAETSATPAAVVG
jgi:phosphate ABC transporter permease protein PstC